MDGPDKARRSRISGRIRRVDGAAALERDIVELVSVDRDIGVGINLVALDDVLRGDLITAIRVDLGVLDAVAGIFVNLIEGDLSLSDVAGKSATGQVTSDSR
jgi:hypothetical protein